MRRIVVLDSSSIGNWLEIEAQSDFDMFQLLRQVAYMALVPTEVQKELAMFATPGKWTRARIELLKELDTVDGFYQLCPVYDSLLVQELTAGPSSKVQAGEAEVVVQASEINTNWVVIDDRKCKVVLESRYPSLHHHSSIELIFLFEELGYVSNAADVLEILYKVAEPKKSMKLDTELSARKKVRAFLNA
jgi:predicted nucleic acid-binding protein